MKIQVTPRSLGQGRIVFTLRCPWCTAWGIRLVADENEAGTMRPFLSHRFDRSRGDAAP